LCENEVISVGYTGLIGDRGDIGDVISKYVFNYPINNAVVGWQGTIRPWLVARTHLGALDRYSRSPYAVWDASLARPNGRVRPFLQLTNITDTIYQEVLGVPMPRRGVIGGMEIVMPLAK
jgi:iron complex outermembrane receptor protein